MAVLCNLGYGDTHANSTNELVVDAVGECLLLHSWSNFKIYLYMTFTGGYNLLGVIAGRLVLIYVEAEVIAFLVNRQRHRLDSTNLQFCGMCLNDCIIAYVIIVCLQETLSAVILFSTEIYEPPQVPQGVDE